MPANLSRSIAVLGICVLCLEYARAEVVDLPTVRSNFEIDGVLLEDAWQAGLQIELDVETDPGENIPAPVRTVAYLLEDGENLYVAIQAFDPDPSKIRAYLRDRDTAYDDDFAGIIIDTFNDGRRAFEFFSNPLGIQMDLTNDDVNKKEDDSWDAIWESGGKINDEGYVIEMRIPLSQLRFPVVEGKQTWAIDLQRTYPRDRRYRLSNNPGDRSINCYLCRIGKITGLENVAPGRDLEIVPTLTASQTDSTDDPGVTPLVAGDAEIEAGLSVSWGITPDVTANLALNPDFSQIEADAAQLDVNNRFALFFPEKRPFFLEGADYFTTPLQAVFTRTVADPNIGMKLTGKRGDNTFGVFAANDDVTNVLFPGAYGSDATTIFESNTAFVGRYSRGFRNASSIGGLVTVRDGENYYNYVSGIDVNWKLDEQHSFEFQYLESDTEYPFDVATEFEQPLQSFSGSNVVGRYHFESRNWFANVGHRRTDEGFRADAGFEPRVDAIRYHVNGGRVWFGEENNWWTRIRIHSDYQLGYQNDGTLTDRDIALRVGIGGPMQSWTQIVLTQGAEYSDGVIFNKKRVGLFVEAKPRGGFYFSIYAHIADRIDYANTRLAEQFLFEPALNWNVGRHLLLRLRGAYSDMQTMQDEDIFTASVVDARLTWQFDHRSFLRLTVQSTDIDRNPAVYNDVVDSRTRNQGRQLLYSYKINPQTVFFLGYSDQFVDDDSLLGYTASNRSWFMKIGYAWTL